MRGRGKLLRTICETPAATIGRSRDVRDKVSWAGTEVEVPDFVYPSKTEYGPLGGPGSEGQGYRTPSGV